MKEGRYSHEINVIFVDHHYIIKLNQQFLQRDTTTDVIAFPLMEPNSKIITGEVYINLDLVSQQAAEYGVTVSDETNRVVVHGVLHLLGYQDNTGIEKENMHAKEDYYLQLNNAGG